MGNIALARYLFWSLVAGIVLLGLSAIIIPDRFIESISFIPAKIILVFFGSALMIFSSLLVYWIFYLPKARRYILKLSQIFTVLLVFSFGISFTGFARIDSIFIGVSQVDIKFQSYEPYPQLAIVLCVIVLVICMLLYILVCYLEGEFDEI